jgi:hypothetical protein
MRMFPISDPMNIGGALVHNDDFYIPSSTHGPMVYLNANPDIQIIIDKIVPASPDLLITDFDQLYVKKIVIFN